MKGFPHVEELERRCRAEGTLLALVHIVERRLGREVTAVERSVLQQHLTRLDIRALDDALDLDAPALEAWLAPAPS